jgi:hypothetical protein
VGKGYGVKKIIECEIVKRWLEQDLCKCRRVEEVAPGIKKLVCGLCRDERR